MAEVLKAITEGDHMKLFELIIDKDVANRSIPNTDGCTPLHIVIGAQQPINKEKMLCHLLELGADPNSRSFEHLTPVHIASMWNNCSELEKLLQNGGNPWLTDINNKNAFDIAYDNHSYEAYHILNMYLAEDKLNFKTIPREIPAFKKQNNNHILCNGAAKDTTIYQSTREHFPLYFSSSDESGFTESTKSSNEYIVKEENNNYMSDLNAGATNLENNSNKSQDKSKNCLNDAFMTLSINAMNSRNDSFEVIIDTDNESGIILVEKCPSLDSLSLKSGSSSIGGDWKTCRSLVSSNNSTVIEVPDEYAKMSNSDIYRELKQLGDNPGPVEDSTKVLYLRRLIKLKNGCTVPNLFPELKYSLEIYQLADGKMNVARTQKLLDAMAAEFSCLNPYQNWREGNQRCSFNYFLLDPRVTQNLPTRSQEISFDKMFLIFIDSLFYIGKGTKRRPYSHLLEAAKASSFKVLKNHKVAHIVDIWDAGYGVISLHCFNNCIPVEAYTQEACIIEALKLDNLTNLKVGDFYGKCSKWKAQWKRQVGAMLLHKAFQIYLIEGEKQIMAKDVKVK